MQSFLQSIILLKKFDIYVYMFYILYILNKGGKSMAATYILKGFNKDLWRKVKALAALRGITIKELIISLLKNEVKKGE